MDRQTDMGILAGRTFSESIQKINNKIKKLRNLNQNTIIRHFHKIVVEGKLKERGCTFSKDRGHNEVARSTETFITDTEENTTCVKIKS